MEVFALLLSMLVAVITAYLTIQSEKKRKRRYLIAITGLFSVITIVLAIEIGLRNQYLDELGASALLEWEITKDSKIDGIEIEIICRGCAASYDDLLEYLSYYEFDATFKLPEPMISNESDPMAISDLITIDMLKNYGAVGSASFNVIVDSRGGEERITDIESIDATFSAYSTSSWIKDHVGDGDSLVSSLKVTIPYETSKPSLNSLQDTDKVTLKIYENKGLSFWGEKDGTIILSIRFLTNLPERHLPMMLEISPERYLRKGEKVEDYVEYSMTVQALRSLLEKNFLASYGFRATKLIESKAGLLRLFSPLIYYTESGVIYVHEVIWSTNGGLDEEIILRYVDYNQPDNMSIFTAGEWQDIYATDITWYRYLAVTKVE